MTRSQSTRPLIVGVLALQGAFSEHILLLRQASRELVGVSDPATTAPPAGEAWRFVEVRTAAQLDECDALIIPGGESTAISLVASRSGMLDPLRDFVKSVPMKRACNCRLDANTTV